MRTSDGQPGWDGGSRNRKRSYKLDFNFEGKINRAQ